MNRPTLPLVLILATAIGCGGNTVQSQSFNPTPTEGSGRSGSEAARATARNAPELGLNAPLKSYRLLPENHPWSRQISRAGVDAESAKWLKALGAEKSVKLDFGTTNKGEPNGSVYAVVDSGSVPLKVTYPKADTKAPATAAVPERLELKDQPNYSVVDRDRNRLVELISPQKVDGGLKAADGWERDLRTDLSTSPVPILPLLVNYDEAVVSRLIQHPLRIQIKLPKDVTLAGKRIRLRTVSKKATEAASATILKSLREFGAILVDGPSEEPTLMGTSDLRWVSKDLDGVRELKLSDFDVIDEPLKKEAGKKDAAKGVKPKVTSA